MWSVSRWRCMLGSDSPSGQRSKWEFSLLLGSVLKPEEALMRAGGTDAWSESVCVSLCDCPGLQAACLHNRMLAVLNASKPQQNTEPCQRHSTRPSVCVCVLDQDWFCCKIQTLLLSGGTTWYKQNWSFRSKQNVLKISRWNALILIMQAICAEWWTTQTEEKIWQLSSLNVSWVLMDWCSQQSMIKTITKPL